MIILNGMEFYGTELNVNIIRPFLDFTKNDIYNIANYYKLPYLYDSTPIGVIVVKKEIY